MLIAATLTRAFGSRRFHGSYPPAVAETRRVPNPDSETFHGETVSVEDPHWQPLAASRNADAKLRLRSSTVGRSRKTTDLSALDLRLQDRRGRTGVLRFRLGSARASRRDG